MYYQFLLKYTKVNLNNFLWYLNIVRKLFAEIFYIVNNLISSTSSCESNSVCDFYTL